MQTYSYHKMIFTIVKKKKKIQLVSKNPKTWYYLVGGGKKIPSKAWYLDNQQVIFCFYCLQGNEKEKSRRACASESSFTRGVRHCRAQQDFHLLIYDLTVLTNCNGSTCANRCQFLPWTRSSHTVSWLRYTAHTTALKSRASEEKNRSCNSY